MNKKDLVSRLASSTGVTKADSKFMLDAVIDVISDALTEGDEVYLPRLGKFYVGTVAAHDVENGLAGGVMHYEKRHQVRFRQAKELRERVNGSPLPKEDIERPRQGKK